MESALSAQLVTSRLTASAPMTSTAKVLMASMSVLCRLAPTTTPPSQRSTPGSGLSSSAKKRPKSREDRSPLTKRKKRKDSEKSSKATKEHRRKEHKMTRWSAEGTPTSAPKVSQASAASASVVPHRELFTSPRYQSDPSARKVSVSQSVTSEIDLTQRSRSCSPVSFRTVASREHFANEEDSPTYPAQPYLPMLPMGPPSYLPHPRHR